MCTNLPVTHIPGSGDALGSFEDSSNFYLSSICKHIEQAFGILVERWKLLQFGLSYSLDVNMDIIETMILLHNCCIDKNEDLTVKICSTTVQMHRTLGTPGSQEKLIFLIDSVIMTTGGGDPD